MEDSEFAGWIVVIDTFDAMEVLQNDGQGPRLFTDHAKAKDLQGWLDVVAPVTKAEFLAMGGVLPQDELKQTRLF